MELEGDPMGVDRSTLVVFPREEATAPVKSDFRTDEGIDTDSSAISRAILQRVIAHTRPDNDGPPLTTKAIRDLQKAQRERVYSRTLIRIKFPDRVCVQAYFHPRNSSDDVYRWLSTCLRDDSSRMVTDERYSFELYLSPPRITLPLSEEKTGGSCLTLAELQLVPAAVVHLAWKAVDGKTVDGCRGSYLQQHLVAEAQMGDDFSGNLNRPIEFPTSQQLVQSVSESLIDATLPMDAASKDDNPHHSTTNTKSTRPKWFK
jgi:tether containing UBX domain for GLUT4